MKFRVIIIVVGVIAVVCVFGILAFMIISPLGRNPAVPAAPAATATARSVLSTSTSEPSATQAKAAASPTLASTATKAAAATQPIATAKPTIAATLPPAPTPAPSPVPTQTPPDSLDYKTICTRDQAMTDAQWNEYLKRYDGRKVTWTGWVNDVYKSSEGYTLYVTFDPPGELFRAPDVQFPITNELGLKLNKDQRITFSGTLGSIKSFLGSCSIIEIKNAVVVKF